MGEASGGTGSFLLHPTAWVRVSVLDSSFPCMDHPMVYLGDRALATLALSYLSSRRRMQLISNKKVHFSSLTPDSYRSTTSAPGQKERY